MVQLIYIDAENIVSLSDYLLDLDEDSGTQLYDNIPYHSKNIACCCASDSAGWCSYAVVSKKKSRIRLVAPHEHEDQCRVPV